MDVTLLVDHQQNVTIGNKSGTIVRALLTVAGTAPTRENRTPVALAFAIDRSGSMDGERVHAARGAAAHAVERLHPDDIVAVTAIKHVVQRIALQRVVEA